MAKLNLLHHLNIYNDFNQTNQPTQSIGKWTTDVQGVEVQEPEAKLLKLQAQSEIIPFSSQVEIDDDNSTTYDIALKAGTSNTYRIIHNSGSQPNFRDARVSEADATTEVTVVKNGPLLTITSSSGTPLDLINGGVLVGDEVRLGTAFNLSNRGKFKILALTATSFTIENGAGVNESVALGVSFDESLAIQSSSGVQVGNKVIISDGFSSASFGTYEITDVGVDYIDIYSTKPLPSESNIQTRINIYNNSKKIIYIESDKDIELEVNGASIGLIEPLKCGTKNKKALFFKTGATYSLKIISRSLESANVLCITAE